MLVGGTQQPQVTHPAGFQRARLSYTIVAFQMPTALSWMAWNRIHISEAISQSVI